MTEDDLQAHIADAQYRTVIHEEGFWYREQRSWLTWKLYSFWLWLKWRVSK